jgi:Zn-dependent M28 family amino/carboxypeptidase
MLAVARDMAARTPARTVRFVAFVNEEPPHFQSDNMGSRVHARNCRQRGDKIAAMLSLETIGCYKDAPGSQKLPYPFGALYPSTGNYIAFVGNTGSRSLIRRCVRTFRKAEKFPSEGGALPEFIPASGLSDQWSFWQEGYPGLMVTDTAYFRYEYYHDARDTPDKLQYDRMARVVEGLGAVVRELTGTP